MSSGDHHIALQDKGHERLLLLGICIFWLMQAFPGAVPPVVCLAIGMAIPFMNPVAAPLLFVTSFFFLSTFSLTSLPLMALRAYWLLFGLVELTVIRRFKLERRLVMLLAIAAGLIGLGAAVAAANHQPGGAGLRGSGLEAALALTWLLAALLGGAFIEYRNGSLSATDLWAIALAWIVSFSYGARQFLLGLGPSTVPPEILSFVLDFAQYENLGRRPFSFRTANAMAVATLVPFGVLLFVWRHRLLKVSAVIGFAVLTGALTLTRSFLIVVLGSTFLLVLLTKGRSWGPAVGVSIVGVLTVGVVTTWVPDLERIVELGRLGEGAGSTRLDIWRYSLERIDLLTVLVGNGFGPQRLGAFFSNFQDLKQLSSPHNVLLEFLLQFGVAGVAFLLYVAWTLMHWTAQTERSETRRAFAFACLLILVRELVATSYVVSGGMLSGLFWFCVGCSSAPSAPSNPGFSPGESSS